MVQYIIFVTVYKENPFPNNYVIRKEKSISIAFTDHCGEFFFGSIPKFESSS